MNSAEIAGPTPKARQAIRQYLNLRIACRIVLLALGAAQAWTTRFTMNSDGVSYLDIGDGYWRGHWRHAINAYWSPLYSWIVGLFLKILKPSMHWEYPVVHFANFVIYVVTLAAFDFFLVSVIAYGRSWSREPLDERVVSLPETAWWLLGYSLFLGCSIAMIGLNLVTPDLCVAGFVFLASAILLRISLSNQNRGLHFSMGIVLGFAYLAKAVMFPLSVVFLATGIVAGRRSRGWGWNATLSIMAFLLISGPFIFAISRAAGRLTFGESGRLTYAASLNGVDAWTPGDAIRVEKPEPDTANIYGEFKHPAKKLWEKPQTFWFGEPISGTYPFWYNPGYWQDGVKAHFDSVAEVRVISKSLKAYLNLLTTLQLNIVAPFLALLLISHAPSRFLREIIESWRIVIPASSGVLLYFLVQTEFRYIAAFVTVLWVAAFHGLLFLKSEQLRSFLIFTSLVITATTVWSVTRIVRYDGITSEAAREYWHAAEALHASGVRQSQAIATVGREPGRDGAYIARLAKVKIVAQVIDPDQFWPASASTQKNLLATLRDAGCVGVLAWNVANPAPGWHQLGVTKYFFFSLSDLGKH